MLGFGYLILSLWNRHLPLGILQKVIVCEMQHFLLGWLYKVILWLMLMNALGWCLT